MTKPAQSMYGVPDTVENCLQRAWTPFVAAWLDYAAACRLTPQEIAQEAASRASALVQIAALYARGERGSE
jgi:hypothetical protein